MALSKARVSFGSEAQSSMAVIQLKGVTTFVFGKQYLRNLLMKGHRWSEMKAATMDCVMCNSETRRAG
jgi:hypothetical protein